MIIRQTTTIVFEYPQDYLQEQEWCKTKEDRWIHKGTDTLGAVYENQISYSIGVSADRKTDNSSEKPNNCEPKICDTCRYYNSNIPCGTTPSACKEADKFAEEFVDELKKLKQTEPTISKMEQVDKDINVRSKDEPQRDCFLCKWLGDVDVCGRCRNRNLFAEADTEPKPKDEPQTDCAWK